MNRQRKQKRKTWRYPQSSSTGLSCFWAVECIWTGMPHWCLSISCMWLEVTRGVEGQRRARSVEHCMLRPGQRCYHTEVPVHHLHDLFSCTGVDGLRGPEVSQTLGVHQKGVLSMSIRLDPRDWSWHVHASLICNVSSQQATNTKRETVQHTDLYKVIPMLANS